MTGYETHWSNENALMGHLRQGLLRPARPSLLGTAMLAADILEPPASQANGYLRGILRREAVDVSNTSPVHQVQATLWPIICKWANGYLLSVEPSGSFSKGTANASGTDIDLFISVSPEVTDNLREIYEKLERAVRDAGYVTRRQNVSINVMVGGHSVDLVPAQRQNLTLADHSLYRRKADSWTKTNVAVHAQYVSLSGRTEEIRTLKLWRDQARLDWPSFFLELTVISALRSAPYGDIAANVSKVFEFLRDDFMTARLVDPANTNNVVSDDLTLAEKARIKAAGAGARAKTYWRDIVR